jgi:outer membrane lipoprotein carrier protein
MRVFASFALAVALAVALSVPLRAEPAVPDAAELTRRVQAFYEATKDYTAEVSQAYTFHAMRRTMRATGLMQLKKPGLMRWEVTSPAPKQFVIDGKSLYIHDLEDNEVMVKRDFSADSLSSAVSFLWGRGQLSKEFDISSVARPEYGQRVLQLVPKRPHAGLAKLFFAVDAETGRVVTSVVVDAEGNENRLDFSKPKTNSGLDDARFKFTVPKGAKVLER